MLVHLMPLWPKPMPRRIKAMYIAYEGIVYNFLTDYTDFNTWLESISYDNLPADGFQLDLGTATATIFDLPCGNNNSDSRSLIGYKGQELVDVVDEVGSYHMLAVAIHSAVVSQLNNPAINIEYEDEYQNDPADNSYVWRDENEIYAISDEISKHISVGGDYQDLEWDGLFSIGTPFAISIDKEYEGKSLPFSGGINGVAFNDNTLVTGKGVMWRAFGLMGLQIAPCFVSKRTPVGTVLKATVGSQELTYKTSSFGYAYIETYSQDAEMPLFHAGKENLPKWNGQFDPRLGINALYQVDTDNPSVNMASIIQDISPIIWFKTGEQKEPTLTAILLRRGESINGNGAKATKLIKTGGI